VPVIRISRAHFQADSYTDVRAKLDESRATLEDAKQLDRLTPMLVIAGEFVALGVSFEAPITNSDVLWEL